MGELDKPTTRYKYKGNDQVHTASGSGMKISHVDHAIVKNPVKKLHLKNILHVPHSSKNLVSVHVLPLIIMHSLNFILTSFFNQGSDHEENHS